MLYLVMKHSRYLVIELDEIVDDYCVAINASYILTINSYSIVPIIISAFLEKPIESVCLDFVCHWLYDTDVLQTDCLDESLDILKTLTHYFIQGIKERLLINGITDYESGQLSLYKLAPRNTIVFERFT